MGRPRKTLPPDGLEIIRQAASKGVKEIDLAKALGLTFKTWKRIRDEDPDAAAAWEEAKAAERDELVGELYRQATKEGNASAAMFLLKSRHGYRDHGQTEGGDTSRVNVVFNLPAPLNPDQYSKLVEVQREPLPASE